MSEKWRQSEICIVTNDESPGSVAKRLSWDGLLHYKFIVQFAEGKELLKSANIRRSYRQSGRLCHTPYWARTFVLEDAELAR